MRSVPSFSSRVPVSVSDQRVSRPIRVATIQPLSAGRMMAWRAAFSATSSSASRSMRLAVQTGRPAGSTNSPSTVRSRLRALAAPSSWRRVTTGPSVTSTSSMVASRATPAADLTPEGSEPVLVDVDVAAALLVAWPHGPCRALGIVVVRPAGGALALGVVASPAPLVRRPGRTGARSTVPRHADLPAAHLLAQPPVLGRGEPVRLEPGGDAGAVGMALPDHVEHVVESARGRLLLEVFQHEGAHAGTARALVDRQQDLRIAPDVVQPAVADHPSVPLGAPPIAGQHLPRLPCRRAEHPVGHGREDPFPVGVPARIVLVHPLERGGADVGSGHGGTHLLDWRKRVTCGTCLHRTRFLRNVV